jgi:mRNA-degrading endonuclease toxin of MazEF toxin-antitoxin module
MKRARCANFGCPAWGKLRNGQGDVKGSVRILERPHYRLPRAHGVQRGKKRPAVVVRSDSYPRAVKTVVVAELTKNLSMSNDSACPLIDVSTPQAQATGLVRDSVVSGPALVTVYTDTIAQVLETLSGGLTQRLNDCLKEALALP